MAFSLTSFPQISVISEQKSLIEKAQLLAQTLHLPFAEKDQNLSWALILSEEHLSLRFPGAKNPFQVDYMEGAYARRLRSASRNNEPLARAVGLKSGLSINLLDGTAGFGYDAILLAKLGANVIAIERSPIVAALLLDGVTRLKEKLVFSDLKIEIIQDQTQEYLQKCTTKLDVIYLDPMFPERPNYAQVKKPMQLLQSLLGEPNDLDDLIHSALNYSPRVVIKRPEWASSLIKKPSFSVPAGTIRFDVYTSRK